MWNTGIREEEVERYAEVRDFWWTQSLEIGVMLTAIACWETRSTTAWRSTARWWSAPKPVTCLGASDVTCARVEMSSPEQVDWVWSYSSKIAIFIWQLRIAHQLSKLALWGCNKSYTIPALISNPESIASKSRQHLTAYVDLLVHLSGNLEHNLYKFKTDTCTTWMQAVVLISPLI